mmetsp:Transcript_12765/g.17145  ORF Transcript_12765/g.17145 Transcript_12765/m.17145 type:complete len:209 (-) Transcript_12765:2365-2991(-)
MKILALLICFDLLRINSALISIDRRHFFIAATATAGDWRSYTALAPLGTVVLNTEKLPGLSLERMADRLLHDITKGANDKGGYLVTGDLDPRIFEDTARFVDPTNDVASLSRYRKALSLLFDPDIGQTVQLIEGPTINSEARSISAKLHVSEGILKALPWRPHIRPFDTNITWILSNDGLVQQQSQVWSISAQDALLQTFSLPVFSKK